MIRGDGADHWQERTMMPCFADRSLADGLRHLLKQVPVLPYCLILDGVESAATIPTLRGIFGRALYGVDRGVYERVFHPPERERLPGYVLRPADDAESGRMALEWILLGEAVKYEEILLRAWDVASGMGLGKGREPFFVRERSGLNPDGSRTARHYCWSADQIPWPQAGSIERTACRIVFSLPVSLMREHRLIESPTLADVVIRTCRRLRAFLPADCQADWDKLTDEAISLARETPSRGEWQPPLALPRYSAAQQRDFAVPGVRGQLHLPEGPGPLWPVFAALTWTHVGKASNLGLGRVRIEVRC
ncbi:MAG: CRISPR system precrRNA processing endoribonuclease RAMP protein Cas6 [Candidatus Paceibacterota bacterium]